MSDEIKTKLKEACVGRPAKIPWPHYVLHEAHDRIEALEADLAAATARADALAGKLERAVEALTPSGDTKAAYMGEFSFSITLSHPRLGEENRRVSVPWTCIKEIMAMIRARAALAAIQGDNTDD